MDKKNSRRTPASNKTYTIQQLNRKIMLNKSFLKFNLKKTLKT